MDKRSSKLDEEISANIDQTGAIATTSETSDNVYLETRSDESFSSDDAVETDTDETSEETEQIRAQIEETRSNMGGTIDAIQEKLSISNITGQVKDEVSDYIQTAKDSVYNATLGKVGNIMNYVNKGLNNVSDTKVGFAARQNPLAISLIGLGLGMLLVNNYTKKRPTYRYNYDTDYDYDRESGYNRGEFSSYNREGDYDRREFSSSDRDVTRDRISTSRTTQDKGSNISGRVSDVAGQAYEGVSDAASRVGSSVSDAAGKVGSSVTDAAGKVTETVGNVANQAYRQVGNLGTKAKDVAGSAQDQYEHYIEENPLAVGAVALALGAAVGLSLPSTRVENHLMGEARENLMQKASETARGAIDKVQEVAGEVKETIQDKVKDQGIETGGIGTQGSKNQDTKGINAQGGKNQNFTR
jgi:ElaB/YqjD/DUF883 family membrane-anchored ribosome-binding protein